MRFIKLFTILFSISFSILLGVNVAFAFEGTIDPVFKHAWSEKAGWINFNPTGGNVIVKDTELTGSIWSKNLGWIKLNPTNSGVKNNNGVLSGYAWGASFGFIDFSGVTINSLGEFTGIANGNSVSGRINFNCSNCKVITTWRPASASSGGGIYPPPAPAPIPQPIPQPQPQPEPIPQPQPEPIPQPQPQPEPIPQPQPQPQPEPQPQYQPQPQPGPKPISQAQGIITTEQNQTIFNKITKTTKKVLIKPVNVVVKSKIFKETKKTIEKPVVKNTLKTIETVGIAIGVGTASAAALPVATTLTNLPYLLFKSFSILAGLLKTRKKLRFWGQVYDSVTKQPLDPVYLVLKEEFGNEVSSSITNIEGHYGFLVPKTSKYFIEPNKTNYSFPSKKLLNKEKDELYENLYFGEKLNLKEGEVIIKNIPMDPINFDWNEWAKNEFHISKLNVVLEKWKYIISDFLFALGGLSAILGSIFVPEPYNLIFLFSFIIVLILRKGFIKPKITGIVYHKNFKPLSFAIIKVYFAGINNLIKRVIADKMGRYYLIVGNGDYYLTIEEKMPDESYKMVYRSDVFSVKSGIINKNIVV